MRNIPGSFPNPGIWAGWALGNSISTDNSWQLRMGISGGVCAIPRKLEKQEWGWIPIFGAPSSYSWEAGKAGMGMGMAGGVWKSRDGNENVWKSRNGDGSQFLKSLILFLGSWKSRDGAGNGWKSRNWGWILVFGAP